MGDYVLVEEVKLLKIHYLILESSALPLAVVLIIFILSGYGLITTTMERFGLNYRISTLIHTSRTFRLLLITLTYAHLCSGFEIMIFRYLKKPRLRYGFKTLLYVLVAASLLPIIYCELLLY